MKYNGVKFFALLALIAVIAILSRASGFGVLRPDAETGGSVAPPKQSVINGTATEVSNSPELKTVRKAEAVTITKPQQDSRIEKQYEQPEEPPKAVKMAVVGDLMVHEWQANNAYDNKTGTYDFKYCFEPVKEYLSAADYTIGNLETTFAGKEAGYGYYPLFNAPDEFAEALLYTGFDFVSTANNHSNDKRKKGILRTIDVLDSLGIEHTGTYKSQEERDTVFYKEINGISFAILSYSYGTNGIPLEEPYLVNLLEDELIKSDIQRAKELKPDFIMVLPHMGNEYERAPREVFKSRIMSMLEAGADIVLASHPHVLQPMEYLEVKRADGTTKKCFVAYSMGNFISSQRTYPRDEGIILNVVFEKDKDGNTNIKSVSYIPTWVKFVNAAGKYDIQVLSVNNALSAYEDGNKYNLRPSDASRLRQVHRDISKMLYGHEIPIGEIRNEYWVNPKPANL